MNKKIRKYIGVVDSMLKLELDSYIKDSAHAWIDNNYHYPIDSRVLAQGLWNAYVNCDEPIPYNVNKFIQYNT